MNNFTFLTGPWPGDLNFTKIMAKFREKLKICKFTSMAPV